MLERSYSYQETTVWIENVDLNQWAQGLFIILTVTGSMAFGLFMALHPLALFDASLRSISASAYSLSIDQVFYKSPVFLVAAIYGLGAVPLGWLIGGLSGNQLYGLPARQMIRLIVKFVGGWFLFVGVVLIAEILLVFLIT